MAELEPTPTRRALLRVNLPLVVWAALLIGYGTLVVWSATSGYTTGPALFKRHLLGLAIGMVPLALAWAIDYKALRHWTGPLAATGVLMLTLVLLPFFGKVVNGQRNWLGIGSLRLFQPSEPVKLILILVLAAVIAEFKGKIETPAEVARVLAFLAVPLVLIMMEPDLGTALVFIVITMGMLLVGGLKPRWFAVFAAVAVVGILLLVQVDSVADKVAGHDVLIKQYQYDRMTVFVNPSVDTTGAGYNLTQSKIAIGSGGLLGKGLRAGTQSNLNFLPERHTDFIFAVLGEELGFVGAIVLLGLYLALLVTALEISASSRDLFGALIVTGLISMWTFQILVNIGMTVGIMPITGIPLPFMSFGSSFMVTNLAGIGMLLSVWARRYGT
jgi:rod shape determining protein RodA